MSATFMTAVVQGPEWFACWDNASGEGTVAPMGKCHPRPKTGEPRELDEFSRPGLVDLVAAEFNLDPGEVNDLRLCWGFGVRASASGYMDCTDWSFYATAEEAEAGYWEEREALDDGDPEAIARAVNAIPAARLVRDGIYQRDNYRTFRAAGIPLPHAVRMCRGLEFLSALGDRSAVEWVNDDEPASCACGAPRCDKEHNGHTAYGCVVKVLDNDGDEHDSESLWGIDFGKGGEPHGKGDGFGYAKHVEAELAAELLSSCTPDPLGLPVI